MDFNFTTIELANGKEIDVPQIPNFEELSFWGEDVPSLEEQTDMINEAIEMWRAIEAGDGKGLTPMADLDRDEQRGARAIPIAPAVAISYREPPFTPGDSGGQAGSGNRFGAAAPRGVAANEVCMIPDWTRYARPPVEDYSGAYYYKMSQNNPNTMRSLRIRFNPRHIQMRNNITSQWPVPVGHQGNNAYVFLSAFGQGVNPPEFGVMSGVGHHGRWHWFTRNAGAGVVVRDNNAAGALTVPDQITTSNGNHLYTYTSNADPSRRYTDRTQLTIRISVDGNDLIGEIWNANTGQRIIPRAGQPTVRISGQGANWNSFRTFLVGVSYVPEGTANAQFANWTNWRPRNTFLRNLDIHDQWSFSGANWAGTRQDFIPTPGQPNINCRYGLIPRFRGCGRQRFGMGDERIMIDNR